LGCRAIPQEWVEGICDQPRSVRCLTKVAERLSQQKATPQALGPVSYFWPWLLVRNSVFLVTVLIHGFRRILPPY
jgi:ADP-ribosyl-[dinitrogen reductase] hydrolase